MAHSGEQVGEGSTGAANDLAGATQIATRMIREFGLSPELGPIGYASSHPHYLGETTDEPGRPPYSEQTQRIVDEEVARLLRKAEQRAIALLRDHRAALEHLAGQLVTHETVDGSVVLDVLRQERSPERRRGDDHLVNASPPFGRSESGVRTPRR
ncbi:hypothetical protein [Streptomyces griseoluteus]|uniref:hypothetical protein n=1 Tax=Streptomyces griseoluteus TaxID=29306 RepID=UPI0036FDC94A